MAVHTGWTGYGPKTKKSLQSVLPVCFRQYSRSVHS
jgi:hypothetical protein